VRNEVEKESERWEEKIEREIKKESMRYEEERKVWLNEAMRSVVDDKERKME
jgi:hypothetical protein